jgi:hypothetical protein
VSTAARASRQSSWMGTRDCAMSRHQRWFGPGQYSEAGRKFGDGGSGHDRGGRLCCAGVVYATIGSGRPADGDCWLLSRDGVIAQSCRRSAIDVKDRQRCGRGEPSKCTTLPNGEAKLRAPVGKRPRWGGDGGERGAPALGRAGGATRRCLAGVGREERRCGREM